LKTDILLVPMSARWADMRAAALAVEEAGFDGVWTWDHLRDPEGEADPDAGVPEAMTVLAALAEATRRIALGPLVLYDNTQARHPNLTGLLRIARDEHRASGRDPARFVATVFAGLEPRWLRASSRDRSALEGLGVDRLILLVSPPFDSAEIRAAGRMLTPAA
jgi:hypothetical protein